MTQDKINKMYEVLIDKTEDGTLIWKFDGGLRTVVNNNIILLSKYQGSGTPYIKINIISPQGTAFEKFYPVSPTRTLFSVLFDTVESKFYGQDELIDSIIDGLK